MSEESAKAFLKKWYQGELEQIIRSTDTEEQFFAVVKASGFDFTTEEWIKVATPSRRELSEEELGEVSGGHSNGAQFCINIVRGHRGLCGEPGAGSIAGHFDKSRCADHVFEECNREPCVGYNGDHSGGH